MATLQRLACRQLRLIALVWCREDGYASTHLVHTTTLPSPQAKAAAHRRARNLDAAQADLNAMLSLFPRYTRGLRDLALLQLDSGRPQDALHTLKQVLRLDRAFPKLDDWIVQASAEVNRDDLAKAEALQRAHSAAHTALADQTLPPDAQATLLELAGRTNHYTVLQLCHDFDEAELRKAFRQAGRTYHPDKVCILPPACRQLAGWAGWCGGSGLVDCFFYWLGRLAGCCAGVVVEAAGVAGWEGWGEGAACCSGKLRMQVVFFVMVD
jgi:hypothetical protein